MKTIKIVGIGIVLAIVMVFVVTEFISYDMSNRATSSETLQPNGTIGENALVVYDSSITGNTKNVASIIASILPDYGYTVNLVNINGIKAANISNYDVIIVGGPIYGGNISAAVKKYLETLKPAKDTRVGVFATGPYTTNDVLIKKQVASISENNTLQIKIVTVFFDGEGDSFGEGGDLKCAEFVDNLLNRI